MTKIGGRQVEVGIGIETSAGTPVAATDYFKWDEFSFQAMSDKALLQSARGIRNQSSNSIVIKQYGKGSVGFVPTVDIMPYVMGLVLGSRSSGSASGETTGAYDHTFTVQNANASMKTATLLVKQGGNATERYSNCVVDSFDFSADKDLAKVKLGILGAYPDTGSVSPSYTQDTLFSRNQLNASFGASLTAALGTPATSILTSDGTSPANNDTVTIGNFNGPAIVYTFKTTLTGAAYEVLIGADAAAALANLKKAINNAGTAGTNYGISTEAHPSVYAGAIDSTTLAIFAKRPGTAGNAITTAEGSSHLSWTSTVMASGAASETTPLVAFSLSINNNVLLEEAFLSGSAQPVTGGFLAGPLSIKGSYTLHFSDTVELAKYKANTTHAMVVTMVGAPIGLVSQEKIQFKLGRVVLTKAPLEYQLDDITIVKQEFEVQYDATDKECTCVITNAYAGTNYQ